MKILIHVFLNYKTNNLKMFKADTKYWLHFRVDIKQIIISHNLKLYAKNFNCTKPQLASIIKIAKKMKDGTIRNKMLL